MRQIKLGGNKSRIRYVNVLLLLLATASGIFAGRVFWWTVSSSAEITTRDHVKRGVTLGQTSIGPVEGTDLKANYGFWNDMFDSVIICIEVTPTRWVTGDVELFQSISMEEEDVIGIFNCGNTRLNLGLAFLDDGGTGWSIGQTIDENRFVLRAQFDYNDEPPLYFHPVRDFIKELPVWASELIYGPEGHNLMINQQINLWLQFIAPARSSHFGESTLAISLLGKTFLP